jgi:serine/threonine protein kinase
MGAICTTPAPTVAQRTDEDREKSRRRVASERRNSHIANIHVVNPDIIVHTVVTGEMDHDHVASMMIPLGECSDEQLLAEVARRKLDLHDKITDSVVRETYDFGKVLGHGASGEVLLATHKATKKTFACKVVRKDAKMNDAQSMSTEIEIMKRIRHRNVVSMYELFETPKCLWIILELVNNGGLHHYMAQVEVYSERLLSGFVRQILAGVHYLHASGVVHRDLKIDNILTSGSGPNIDVKIADFGLSALVRIGEDGYDINESTKRKNYRLLTEMWGTKEYFAPELIDQAYGPQADLWAVGCILFEMLCGHQAFPIRERDDEESFYGRIQRGGYELTRPVWKKVGGDARDLVQKLLIVDPVKRLSASEAERHPWVTNANVSNEHIVDAHAVIRQRYLERRNKAKR